MVNILLAYGYFRSSFEKNVMKDWFRKAWFTISVSDKSEPPPPAEDNTDHSFENHESLLYFVNKANCSLLWDYSVSQHPLIHIGEGFQLFTNPLSFYHLLPLIIAVLRWRRCPKGGGG